MANLPVRNQAAGFRLRAGMSMVKAILPGFSLALRVRTILQIPLLDARPVF
jgi:hypothetical protein